MNQQICPKLARSLECDVNSPFATTVKNLCIAAPSSISVLLQGETGTGKELAAKALHALSHCSEGPLVAINCGALPEPLLESTLFGHRRGSFTGAEQDRDGLIQAAQGGTLFLDEIGEMPLAAQSRLLRVLQERLIRPLGGIKESPVNFRLVCATNRNLEYEAQQGRFRADLLFRIAVFPIALPPLQKRFMDIPRLATNIWEDLGRGIRPLHSIELNSLMHYRWPGNIRELCNVLERHHLLHAHKIPLTDHLPKNTSSKSDDFIIPTNIRTNLLHDPAIISKALHYTQHNRTRAAHALGISRGSLLYQMEKFGLR